MIRRSAHSALFALVFFVVGVADAQPYTMSRGVHPLSTSQSLKDREGNIVDLEVSIRPSGLHHDLDEPEPVETVQDWSNEVAGDDTTGDEIDGHANYAYVPHGDAYKSWPPPPDTDNDGEPNYPQHSLWPMPWNLCTYCGKFDLEAERTTYTPVFQASSSSQPTWLPFVNTRSQYLNLVNYIGASVRGESWIGGETRARTRWNPSQKRSVAGKIYAWFTMTASSEKLIGPENDSFQTQLVLRNHTGNADPDNAEAGHKHMFTLKDPVNSPNGLVFEIEYQDPDGQKTTYLSNSVPYHGYSLTKTLILDHDAESPIDMEIDFGNDSFFRPGHLDGENTSAFNYEYIEAYANIRFMLHPRSSLPSNPNY